MAYNEYLVERIENYFQQKKVPYRGMKMMGGYCFMVDEKMCVGVVKDEVMARIGTDNYEEALKKEGCKEMNFTGRAMKGYVFLTEDATDLDSDLEYWVELALVFNPFAKASKKKK
ncbi:TfoX/Sxy family protein [Flavicella marina]|uniref:TfoX/Sxy family protein n=1 Tax=Flavicella marina TaxID=1475951 RepID=UPI001264116C|nr:TfoX/Sxy family protein [Flavicella marina]